jgi:hypothetical protein
VDDSEDNKGSQVQGSVSKALSHENKSEENSIDGILKEHCTIIPTPSLMVSDESNGLEISVERSSPQDILASQCGWSKPSLASSQSQALVCNESKQSISSNL